MRLRTILSLIIACIVPAFSFSYDFSQYWPWIYENITSSGTNSSLALAWVQSNSNSVFYMQSHTNLWDQALTNGSLTASNNWLLAKSGNRFILTYSTNASTLGGHPWSDVPTTNDLVSTQQLGIILGPYSTNAGTGTTNLWCQSNGVWVTFVPGAGGSGTDTTFTNYLSYSGPGTYNGAARSGSNELIISLADLTNFGVWGYAQGTGWVDQFYYPRSNPSNWIDLATAGLSFLGLHATADNSSQLNGHPDTYFYPASNPSNYVTASSTNGDGSWASQRVAQVSMCSREPMGVCWDISDKTTLSFTNATRTWAMATNGNNTWTYWHAGTPTTISSNISIQISTNLGSHFIYYNAPSGTLTESTSPWNLSNTVQLAIVYWDGTEGHSGDERHGMTMDWRTHELEHNTLGTRWASGLATVAGVGFVTNTAGAIYDEDLRFDIAQTTNCSLAFRTGGVLKVSSGWNVPYLTNTSGVIVYDTGTTTSSVPAGSYVASWVFAANVPANPIIVVVGQRTDTSLANARANNNLSTLLTGSLPMAEMKPLARLIYHRASGTGTLNYDEAQDLRAYQILSAVASPTTPHDSTIGAAESVIHTNYLLVTGGSLIGPVYAGTNLYVGTNNTQILGSTNLDSTVWTTDASTLNGQTASQMSVSNASWISGMSGDWVTNPPSFSVKMSGAMSGIPSGAWTNIIFNSVVKDTHSGFSISTYRYTIPRDGYWLVGISEYFNPVPALAGVQNSAVWDNGGTILMQSSLYSGAYSVCMPNASKLCYLTSNSYIYARAYVDRTGLTVSASSEGTYFWGQWTRP